MLNSKKGFSLLELLVVLVIIGLAAMVTFPALAKGLSTVRLKASVREVAAVLREARSLAVSKCEHQVLNIDMDEGKFWLNDDESHVHELPPDVRFLSVQVQGSEFKEGKPAITFYPIGNSSGGTITVGGDQKVKGRIEAGLVTGIVEVSFED
ncbi:MAG: prepilin-type N-terminal cleavage/methylation domain-containing protein [Pseudomonadota bacterium]